MLLAMSQGNDGSMCSIHADSSKGVFSRLAMYAAMAQERLDPEVTNLLVGNAVHLIVHMAWVGGIRRITCGGTSPSAMSASSTNAGVISPERPRGRIPAIWYTVRHTMYSARTVYGLSRNFSQNGARMAARRSVRTAAEVPLSKQRLVTEAIRLADSEGVDKLSMRRLADELGAGAMSLYYYVANKDELLDAMIDVVFEEIELPPDPAGWKAAMRQRAVSARQVLARHPWAITLMESRTAPGPANLRHHEAVIACLRKAGFSVEMATHAYWLLDSYVYGFALQEASLPFDTAEEFAEMGEDVYMPQLPPDHYPYLNEAAATLLAAGYDPADEFTFGLDLILGSLETLAAAP